MLGRGRGGPASTGIASPAASISMAMKWRRSWRRCPWSPTSSRMAVNRLVTQFGFHGSTPWASRANTNVSLSHSLSNRGFRVMSRAARGAGCTDCASVRKLRGDVLGSFLDRVDHARLTGHLGCLVRHVTCDGSGRRWEIGLHDRIASTGCCFADTLGKMRVDQRVAALAGQLSSPLGEVRVLHRLLAVCGEPPRTGEALASQRSSFVPKRFEGINRHPDSGSASAPSSIPFHTFRATAMPRAGVGHSGRDGCQADCTCLACSPTNSL